MALVDLSFRTAHVPSRDDSDQILAGGKNEKQQAFGIGAAKNIKSSLGVRVRFVRRSNYGLVEKNLFTLKWADLMLSPDFVGVLRVPLKSEISGEICFAHGVSIL